MAIDIKEKIEELVKKISGDKATQDSFKKDPVKTVEKLLGIDLPDEQINQIVAGIKAKLGGDGLAGIAEKLGGILGKKN